MICVALSDNNPDTCLSVLSKVEMAEIRLDLTEFNSEDIKKVFADRTPLIATCRPDKTGDEKQLKILTKAIQAGANFVDIEIEAKPEQREAIIETAKKHNCKVIISYHNFKKTPGLRDLFKIADECYKLGADIAKLAVWSKSKADNAKLLSLYSIDKPIVALAMGEEGKTTRIMAPFLGAEFTFAAMDDGNTTAPGQIGYSKMKKLITEIERYM